MKVRYATADTNITVRNGPTLQFGQAGEAFRSCFSVTSVRATAANTNRVTITGASGTGFAKQTTTIDETNGDFSNSNPNLRFFVLPPASAPTAWSSRRARATTSSRCATRPAASPSGRRSTSTPTATPTST